MVRTRFFILLSIFCTIMTYPIHIEDESLMIDDEDILRHIQENYFSHIREQEEAIRGLERVALGKNSCFGYEVSATFDSAYIRRAIAGYYQYRRSLGVEKMPKYEYGVSAKEMIEILGIPYVQCGNGVPYNSTKNKSKSPKK